MFNTNNINTIKNVNFINLTNSYDKFKQLIDNNSEIPSIYLQTAIEEFTSEIQSMDNDLLITNEGLITKSILAILDGIIAMLNRFRRTGVNLIKLSPSYSELQVYSQNNKFKIYKILKGSYSLYMNVFVQNPPLRIAPIKNIEKIIDMNNALQILNISSASLPFFEEYISYLKIESFKDIDKSLREHSLDKSLGKNITLDLTKLLNIRIDNIPFGKLFTSVDEFKSYYTKTLSLNNIFNDTKTIIKTESKSQKIINKFIQDVKDENIKIENNKQFALYLNKLSKYLFTLAEYYEAYGNILKVYTQIEHNNVEIFNVLKKKL